MRRPKKRDPLQKLHRLNTPGQSTYDRSIDLLWDKIGFWVLMASGFATVTFMEFMQSWFAMPQTPWPYLLAFVCVLVLGAWRIKRAWPQLKAARQGYRGELAVGQLLDQMRAAGYEVFHDIDAGRGGNIDHAVIGPAGVFAIETKTISLPSHRQAMIQYDGQRLAVDGQNPADFGHRDPLNQAKSSAARLCEMLADCTGRRVPVQAVLLYPGWWVNEPRGEVPVWVLNPQRFVSRLRYAPPSLSEEDVALFASNLKRVVAAK